MQMQIPRFHLYIEVIQNSSSSLVWIHPTSFWLMSLLTGLFIQRSLFQTKKKHNTTFLFFPLSLSLSLSGLFLSLIHLFEGLSVARIAALDKHSGFWATTDCSVSHRWCNNKCTIHAVTQSFEIPWEIKQKKMKNPGFLFCILIVYYSLCVFLLEVVCTGWQWVASFCMLFTVKVAFHHLQHTLQIIQF